MLKIVIILILILILAYASHFIIINIGNLKRKTKTESKNKKNFFAILIAARNEELVVEKLVNSLKRQNYPSDKYEIYVIANNCTDNTACVAKKAGATVIECTEKVKSKGEVLKYTFGKLKENKGIDAYAIFDADNLVDNNFLNEMNNTINEGYNVSQGFRDTKNIGDNWLSSSYALLYYIDNLFINRARHYMKRSAILNGTGIVIKKEVIDKYGYNPKTLTEDIEFTVMCVLNDEKIAFTETAIIYDEQVTELKLSMTQRKRWSFGSIQCLKIYYKALLKKMFEEKSYSAFDLLLFTLSTIFHVLSAAIIILLALYTIINIKSINITNLLLIIFIVLLIVYVCGILVRMYLIKRNNKKIKDNIGGILLFDIFLLTWIPINLICLFMDKCNWDSIKHNRNIEIDKA